MAGRMPKALKPRKMPRQARSEATVDTIFEATIQVLVTSGVRRTTTTRIAERAGVSVGTLYQYFPHKQALLYAVIERYLNEVAEAVEKNCQQNHGQPIAIASDALVTAYIDVKIKQAEISRMLYLASSDLEMTSLVNAIIKRFHDAAVRLLASAPDVRFRDLDGITFGLLTALVGATRVAIENRYTPVALDRFRDHMMAMCPAFLKDAAIGQPKPIKRTASKHKVRPCS